MNISPIILLSIALTLFASNLLAQDNYKHFIKLSYDEIDSLMMIEYQKGAFDKAILPIKAGRDKAKSEFGNQDTIFATYCAWEGFLYQQTGQYDKALPLYMQAWDIYQKVLGKEHPHFATSLNNLADLHRSMGNYDKALPLLTQARDIKEKVLGKEHPSFAQSLNSLAAVHESMGNYDKALPLLTQARDIREKVLGKDHPHFAQSLNNLAHFHKSMGNYDKALPLYTQARDIREKVLGKDHPHFAQSLNNLAMLHESMGNYDKALPLLTQARDIREKILGKDHPNFAISLNNLAALHGDMGNYDKALPLLTQAQDIKEKVLGKDHPNFAISLNNLAHFHKIMGNYDKALPLFTQARDIYQKVLGKDHPDFATSLNNLAHLHKSMGNYDKAWNMLHWAINSQSRLELSHSFDDNWLDSLKNAPYPSNQHIENMVDALRIAYQTLKKDSSIVDVITKQTIVTDLATALLIKSRNQVSNEKDKLRMLTQSNDWLLRSLEVLTPKANSNKAFNRADENKSVLLLQATKSEAAYRLGELPDSLVFKDKKMLKRQSQLQAKLLEKRSKAEKDSLRNILNKVNQGLDDFAKMIEKDYPKYHKLKYQQVDAKAEDIQILLDDETALLEFVIGDSVVHIFLVDHQNVQWQKTYISNNKLVDNIKALHKSLSNYELVTKDKEKAYESYTNKAHWFYQKLIAPVLKDKQNIKNLIVVSDGELGHLPFETFLVQPAPQSLTDYHDLHYLVNDFNISYNYSATLWKENKEAPKPQNNGQILAMAANYDIKLDSSMLEVRLPTDQWLREALKPLPAARKEVETLQGKYEGFFAFDTLASEKTVKEKASQYAVLHFATHGILDAKRPVLSSLAMTEDNDSTESNFWQAHEISKIQLNADLVVLSACETGFGKFEKGNGIASLARAFMYAGAPALIVSLWQVNDYATSEIMKNLYDNLANGMKKDEALRQAKLQYMKSAKGVMAHPAFWSPFIMMGKTDTMTIKRKGNPMTWGIGIGVLVLLGLGGFAMKKNRDA